MGSRVLPRKMVVLVGLILTVACTGSEEPPSAGPAPSEKESVSSSPQPERSGNKGDKKGGQGDPERTVSVPGGATLTSLPSKAEELCTEGPPVSIACPLLVPHVRKTSYLIDSFGRPGGRFQVLELAAGAPSNKDFSRNAPPRVAHVVIESGKPGSLIDIGEPYPNKLPLEVLLGEELDQAQYVTADGWGETLILAPSFPSGGAHGDHLIYSWKQGGYEHRISLHAWTPAAEAVRTLRAIVRSAKSP